MGIILRAVVVYEDFESVHTFESGWGRRNCWSGSARPLWLRAQSVRASGFRSLTMALVSPQKRQLSFLSLGWALSYMVRCRGEMLKTGSQRGFSEVKGLRVLVFLGILVLPRQQ